jgi:hypothetical protein
MAHSAHDYMTRADECARLANLTKDEMIQVVLLRQRQMYLKMAENLGIISAAIPVRALEKQE